MVKYRCVKCNTVNDAESWNKQTIIGCQDDDITPIQEINFDKQEGDIHCFDCPSCLQTCYVDNGDIAVVKGGKIKGLVVKSPWIDLILKGEKTWEIRGSNTKIRGEIALIKSGTGTILGTVDLVDSKPLTLEEYQESEAYHRISKESTFQAPYKKIHAWVLKNPVLFEDPIPYEHPQGAVIWVNLPEIDLERG
jgi:hypothetical protein